MNRQSGRSAAAALVALALAGPLAAADAKFGVKDDAKFFSQTAVDRTSQRLGQMAKTYNINFRIETVALSEAEQKKAGATNAEHVNYVKGLANKRFSELGMGPRDGLVLIVRKPSQVHAHFGTEATSGYFNEANGKKLASQIANDLTDANRKGGNRDGALDTALSALNDGAFKMTAPPRPGPKAAAPQAGGGNTVDSVKKTSKEVVDNAKKDVAKGKEAVQGMSTSTLIILGVVVALVMLFALKGLFGGGRSRQAGGYAPPPPVNYGGGAPGGQGMNQPLGYGRPPVPPPQGYPPQGGYPQQPPQGGGGGFMKGMLGGMLGGAAGAYMYEKMSGGHAHGGTPTGGGSAGGGSAGTTGGGDYSATGDFGDAPAASGGGDYSASGDFGGDDAASGGDYGAGGDFSAEPGGGDYGAGGDFGGDDAGGGGDYGAGGDFGGDDASGGGDFGGDDDS